MKDDVERPTRLIDISRLPLKTVETRASGGLRIGALVPNSDLAYHPLIEARYPLLASAILAGASQQLRNMASTGGNLLQRTRCSYFYDTATPCNKREPGSGCSAIDGLNRDPRHPRHERACIATHPSDMCVALAALDAKVHVTGPGGERAFRSRISIACRATRRRSTPTCGPTRSSRRSSCRPQGFAANYSYLKIRDRLSYAFALVSVAAALELDGGHHGGAPRARRRRAQAVARPEAEAALRGQAADAANFAGRPICFCATRRASAHNEFKIDLARRAIVRALTQAANGTPQIAVRTRRSREHAMSTSTILYRYSHIPRRRPCESHRRGEIRWRVQRRRTSSMAA